MRRTLAKTLASSVNRNHFPSVTIVRDSEIPLFRLERKGIDEVPVDFSFKGRVDRNMMELRVLTEMGEVIDESPSRWIVVAHPAGLALRGISHLFPPGGGMLDTDFLWCEASAAHDGNPGDDRLAVPDGWNGSYGASRGLWAVRSEHWTTVLETCRTLMGEMPRQISASALWTQVVHELPLRKQRFERGEVLAPQADRMNWDEILRAAYVTVPDWPPEAQRRFLQALYFSTYYGDAGGSFLNILES
ncbi:hypothetical protein [Luteolibacter luteus]|uniref:Uncharacterized protein n=1 Tax=Luteolibacter luteus TaxID=2728835 RepID=A0A858RKM4_9BACT|nr:hypothetical protein [Luteolibacter luteus]QJE96939.1 hypothetical protein HHL09_14465 [Luteolibacter luteus]